MRIHIKPRLTGQSIQLDSESCKSNLQTFFKNYSKSCRQLTLDEHVFRSKRFTQRLRLTKGIQSIQYIKSHRVFFKQSLYAFKNQKYYLKKVSGLDSSLLPYFPFTSTSEINMLDSSSIETFRTLPTVQKLVLNFTPSWDAQRAHHVYEMPEQLESRFWKHLYSSKTLKSLLINCQKSNRTLMNFLAKLNEQEHILKNLTNLVLSFSFEDSKNISSQLFPLSNVLKYVTKVEATDAMIPASHYLFDNIGQCSKLKILHIDNFKNRKLPGYLAGGQAHINFEPIKQLATLNHLQRLDIAVMLSSPEYCSSFLTLFKLPSSIVSVSLALKGIKWSYILQEPADALERNQNPFEENADCREFYSQWERLRNLSTLSFKFELGEGVETIPTVCFLTPVLSKVSKITALEYINRLNWEPSSQESFNLEHFWTTIDHLKPTLKRLWVEDKNISIKDFTEKSEDLCNISEMMIYGSISSDQGFKNVVELFRGSRGQDTNQTALHVRELYMHSSEHFTELVNVLIRKPTNLDIKMHIDVLKVPVEVVVENLCRLNEEGAQNRTISLYLINSKRLGLDYIERLDSLPHARQVFGGLRILATNRIRLFELH